MNTYRAGASSATFDIGAVVDAAFTSECLMPIVLATVIGLVFGTVAALLPIILASFFLKFYVLAATMRRFDSGYAKGSSLRRGSREGTGAAPSG